jgi:glycosyltransferase involved in cell wall biosynthesis
MRPTRRTTVETICGCKGRGHHLKDSWPTFVRQRVQGFDYQATVVEYGCPDPNPEGITSIIVTDGTEWYSAARAKNIGACESTADILFFCDADYILPFDFVQRNIQAMTLNRLDLLVCADGPGAFFGCFFITRSAFHRVRGFDERFENYGYDDTDFLWRCRRALLRWSWVLAGGLEKIPHTCEESIRHVRQKDQAIGLDENLKIMQNTRRRINPDGFGLYANPRLAELRSEFPWPETRPDKRPDGFADWYRPENKKHLRTLLAHGDVRLIVELGTSLGVSARDMLDHAPHAHLCTIDSFPNNTTFWSGNQRETCMVNCWEYRDRLTMLHMDSVEGLHRIKRAGLRPHLIYVDADHSEEGAERDILACLDLFPESILTGDDYQEIWPVLEKIFGDELFIDNAYWAIPQ